MHQRMLSSKTLNQQLLRLKKLMKYKWMLMNSTQMGTLTSLLKTLLSQEETRDSLAVKVFSHTNVSTYITWKITLLFLQLVTPTKYTTFILMRRKFTMVKTLMVLVPSQFIHLENTMPLQKRASPPTSTFTNIPA